MATYPAGQVGLTQAATFIPEIWSDEIIATYEKNLVLVPLIKNLEFSGKKGDTVHVPAPTRGDASAKAAGTVVTTIQNTESEVAIVIDQHWEYSRFIEDIASIQALNSLRQFYTSDAGYALSKRADTSVATLGRGVNGGSGTNAYTAGVIGGDGSTAYVAGSNNATALTDVGLRTAIQNLDDDDVPMEGRFLVIPPVARKTLLGLDRFTVFNDVGEAGGANSIRTGKIGDIYGIPVYVSTNCDTTSGSTAARACLLAHRDFAVFVSQLKPRTQTQYKQEYLADLLTADMIYGTKELRDYAAIALIIPA
jgi:N4-gp56 family major capsid protein